jgi:hypothetical protein
MAGADDLSEEWLANKPDPHEHICILIADLIECPFTCHRVEGHSVVGKFTVDLSTSRCEWSAHRRPQPSRSRQ